MDWLTLAANIVQVISGIWAIVFGGKVITEVIQAAFKKRLPRLRASTITNILLALILLVLLSPFSHWPPFPFTPQSPSPTQPIPTPNISVPPVHSIPSPSPSPTQPIPTPNISVPPQLQSMLANFCNAINNQHYSYAYTQFVTNARHLQETLQTQHAFERYTTCIPIDPRDLNQTVHMRSPNEATCQIQLQDSQKLTSTVSLLLINENDWKIYEWRPLG